MSATGLRDGVSVNGASRPGGGPEIARTPSGKVRRAPLRDGTVSSHEAPPAEERPTSSGTG